METEELNTEAFSLKKDPTNRLTDKKPLVPYHVHESILLILWGWIMFIDYFRFFLSRKMCISFDVRKFLEYFSTGIVVIGIVYTLYYLSKRSEKLKTEPGKSLLIVWGSLFVSMVMVNLMQMNVLHKVIFELQHIFFMLLTAIAISITGRLLHNSKIFYGGIVFAILAFAASYLKLEDQLLLEAIGWLFAFVIPGHLFFKSKKTV